MHLIYTTIKIKLIVINLFNADIRDVPSITVLT